MRGVKGGNFIMLLASLFSAAKCIRVEVQPSANAFAPAIPATWRVRRQRSHFSKLYSESACVKGMQIRR